MFHYCQVNMRLFDTVLKLNTEKETRVSCTPMVQFTVVIEMFFIISLSLVGLYDD